MSDEEYGCVGCLAILLAIGGCCIYLGGGAGSSAKVEKVDANRTMDNYIQDAQKETSAQILTLKAEYEAEMKTRNIEFTRKAQKILSQIEIEQRRTAADKDRDMREYELKTFALRESPKIWETMQHLKAEIELLSMKIKDLESTLVCFSKDPREDEDVIRMCDLKAQLEAQLALVKSKLESAYLASKKYEAMPHRKDFNESMRKSLVDGISAAEMAEKRYNELKQKEQ